MTRERRLAPGETPDEQAIYAQLARIQASPRFKKAPRLRQLLAYLVENSVSGNCRNLRECAVAIEVFGRGADFDPQDDTIVRATVRRLRRSIAEYYSDAGGNDAVEFRIPTGQYRVEVFVAEPTARTAVRHWSRKAGIRLALPVAAFAVLVAIRLAELAGPSIATTAESDFESRTLQHVLLGQQLIHRRGPGDLQHAVGQFEQAVSKDPKNADAWTGLAWALKLLMQNGPDVHGDSVARQYRALHEALALKPDHPEANARMASLFAHAGDLSGTWLYMKRALQYGADNNLVLSMVAGQERTSGNLLQAIELQRRAASRPPLDATSIGNLAYMLYEAGQIDEALEMYYMAEQITPLQPRVKVFFAKALILKGAYEQAEEKLQQVPDGTDKLLAMALLYQATGRDADSRRALQALADPAMNLESKIGLSEALAFRGEFSRAMDEIEHTYEQIRREGGLLAVNGTLIQTMLMSPYHARLAEYPRFEAWARRARADIAKARPELLTLATLEQDTAPE